MCPITNILSLEKDMGCLFPSKGQEMFTFLLFFKVFPMFNTYLSHNCSVLVLGRAWMHPAPPAMVELAEGGQISNFQLVDEQKESWWRRRSWHHLVSSCTCPAWPHSWCSLPALTPTSSATSYISWWLLFQQTLRKTFENISYRLKFYLTCEGPFSALKGENWSLYQRPRNLIFPRNGFMQNLKKMKIKH